MFNFVKLVLLESSKTKLLLKCLGTIDEHGFPLLRLVAPYACRAILASAQKPRRVVSILYAVD